MKFYSETLKELFDTPEALQEAEEKVSNKQQKAETLKNEILDKIDCCIESIKNTYELLDELESVDKNMALETSIAAIDKLSPLFLSIIF